MIRKFNFWCFVSAFVFGAIAVAINMNSKDWDREYVLMAGQIAGAVHVLLLWVAQTLTTKP